MASSIANDPAVLFDPTTLFKEMTYIIKQEKVTRYNKLLVSLV